MRARGTLHTLLLAAVVASGAGVAGADSYIAAGGLSTCFYADGDFASTPGQWQVYACQETGRIAEGDVGDAPTPPNELQNEICVYAYTYSAYEYDCFPLPANAITIDWVGRTASLNAALPGDSGPTTIGFTANLEPQPLISETAATYGYEDLQVAYGQAVVGLTSDGPLTPSSFLYIAGTQGGPVSGESYVSQGVGVLAGVGTSAMTAVCGVC